MKDFQIGEKKDKVRKMMAAVRDTISPDLRKENSLLIAKTLRSLLCYKNAEAVMFFLTCKSEVETDEMIENAWIDNKVVIVPVVDLKNDRLKASKINSLEKGLLRSSMGIREPEIHDYVSTDEIGMVLVPGLAFDYEGYRLGYGKGYYDLWLNDIPVSKRIGMAFEAQIVENLPKTKNDLPVGMIITEKRAIQARKTL